MALFVIRFDIYNNNTIHITQYKNVIYMKIPTNSSDSIFFMPAEQPNHEHKTIKRNYEIEEREKIINKSSI